MSNIAKSVIGQKKRVAIIGSGAAGLVAIDVLSKLGTCDVIAYEKSSGLGGVWNMKQNKKSGIAQNPMYSTTAARRRACFVMLTVPVLPTAMRSRTACAQSTPTETKRMGHARLVQIVAPLLRTGLAMRSEERL